MSTLLFLSVRCDDLSYSYVLYQFAPFLHYLNAWNRLHFFPSIFPRLFRLLFSAPLPYSSRLSPLSECLEQAICDVTASAQWGRCMKGIIISPLVTGRTPTTCNAKFLSGQKISFIENRLYETSDSRSLFPMNKRELSANYEIIRS